MVKIPMVHELLLVTWFDAEEDNHWEGNEGIDRNVLPAKTVGFFVTKTKEYFIVARSVDTKNKNTEGRMKIPHVNLIKIESLTLGKVLYAKKGKAK